MTPDSLWLASATPDLTHLYEEFKRAGGIASQSVRREWNDRIRFCRWKGRTSDYKKHRRALQHDPVPWEDAWDGRIYVADDIIEELGDVLANAFRRAQFSVKPTGPQDLGRADAVKKVMTKYRDDHAKEWADEADFAWQFALNYGASMWQTLWQREIALKEQPITLAQIVGAATQAQTALQQQQAPPPAGAQGDPAANGRTAGQMAKLQLLASLPAMINDPSREDEVAGIVQTFARDLAGQLFATQRAEYGDNFLDNYGLSFTKATQVARDLRQKGQASFPTPYLHRNAPAIVARQVGYDYFAPPEMTDVQSSPWHVVREWLTPVELRSLQATDGWDADWVEAAIKTAGDNSMWGDSIDVADNDDDFDSDDNAEIYAYRQSNTKSGLVEVLHFYARYITEEGVPQVWCTVFCPHALREPAGAEIWAKHYPTNSGDYPFEEYRWKKKRRNFHENQGLPEMIGSDQQQIKRTLDQLEDRKDVEINPAWIVSNRLSMRYKAGPGAQIPRKRQGDIEPMPPPTGNPELGFDLIKHTYWRLAEKFGLMRPEVQPAKSQTKLQRMVEAYLGSVEAMFAKLLALVQANADGPELARMAGADPDFPTDPAEIEGSYKIGLHFDVKDLDMEFVFKKLQAITTLAVPLDRAGVIDIAALVKIIMTAIDPSYAALLIQDKNGAAQKTFADVRNELQLMYNGNEPDYVENDPTAQMKLQFAQQIIFGDAQGSGANTDYLEALGKLPGAGPEKQKPRFQELLQKYSQNLTQSVKQEQNKQIGRLGVQPERGPA